MECEVPILARRADLIGTRDGSLVAVELKLRDWREALRQATAYQLAADRVFVAMPLAGASAAYRERWRFDAEHVGLLAVDDRGGVRVPIPALPSPRMLPFLRDRVRDCPVPPPIAYLPWDFILDGEEDRPPGETEPVTSTDKGNR